MLFSIITVCFNSAKTIRQTFDSVLQQEFKDYEYIVVDGTSTDDTVDIIREYEPKFEGRMRWISEPDKGIYDAMNKGIRMSCGKYLNFMNADDAFEKDVLCKTALDIRGKQGSIFFGMIRGLNEREEEMFVSRTHPNMITTNGYSLCHQGIFEKKELFLEYGFFETEYRIYADLAHMLKLKLAGVEFTPLDFIVAVCRTTGVSSHPDYRERMQVYVDAGLMSQRNMDILLRQGKREKRLLNCYHFLLEIAGKIFHLIRR